MADASESRSSQRQRSTPNVTHVPPILHGPKGTIIIGHGLTNDALRFMEAFINSNLEN